MENWGTEQPEVCFFQRRKNNMLENIKHKIVNFLIICIEILMKKELEGKVNVVLFNEEDYKEFCEYRDGLFIVYENEEDLKNDFPDSIKVSVQRNLH